jgi:hypothetical protein
MRIALGTFTRRGIESQLGSDVGGTVQAALSHYAGKVKSGRPPTGPPRFLPEQASEDARNAFELAVDPEMEALLEREAAKLGTDVSRLAAHSVLVYLAELDFLTSPSRPV